MRERNSSLGLILALAAMGIASGKGNPFEPEPPTPEQKRQQAIDAKGVQQLHRFVIKGQEVWARNKKDAIRKANTPTR